MQKQTFTDYTYLRKDNAIKIELNYELAKNYNYLYYDNITQTNTGLTNKRIFAFITRMEYVNENTTKLYIQTDVIQTYLTEILSDTTSVSYINKQHVKKSDDIIGKYLLDEGIQGSEYVKSQLLDETDYDKLHNAVIKAVNENDSIIIQFPLCDKFKQYENELLKIIPYYIFRKSTNFLIKTRKKFQIVINSSKIVAILPQIW